MNRPVINRQLVKDQERLRIDLVAFNDLKWGWDKQGGKGSLSLSHGKDTFLSFQEYKVSVQPSTPISDLANR